MGKSILYQFFKDKGLTHAEIAAATGYHPVYVASVLTGNSPLTDSARWRFMEAYPETRELLLAPAAQEES